MNKNMRRRGAESGSHEVGMVKEGEKKELTPVERMLRADEIREIEDKMKEILNVAGKLETLTRMHELYGNENLWPEESKKGMRGSIWSAEASFFVYRQKQIEDMEKNEDPDWPSEERKFEDWVREDFWPRTESVYKGVEEWLEKHPAIKRKIAQMH